LNLFMAAQLRRTYKMLNEAKPEFRLARGQIASIATLSSFYRRQEQETSSLIPWSCC
jgi:hypothetical protein